MNQKETPAERQQRRDDLAARVKDAQKAYLDLARVGKSRTAKARKAMELRDQLEAELIALDTAMQSTGETQPELLPMYTRLIRSEKEWKRALYMASQAGNAGGVARALAELEKIWAEKDKRKGL